MAVAQCCCNAHYITENYISSDVCNTLLEGGASEKAMF